MLELTFVLAIFIAVMIFVIPVYSSAARLVRLSGVVRADLKILALISFSLSLHPFLLPLALFVEPLKNHVLAFGLLVSGCIYLIMAGVVFVGVWKGSASFRAAEHCYLMILGVLLISLCVPISERYQYLQHLDQEDELIQIMRNF